MSILITQDAAPLPARDILNFTGNRVTAVDNPAADRVDVTVSSPSKAYAFQGGAKHFGVTHQQALLLSPGGILNNVVRHAGNDYLIVNLAGVYLIKARAEVGVEGSWPAELRIGFFLVDNPTSVSATIYDVATRQFPTSGGSGFSLGYETINLSRLLSLPINGQVGLQAVNIQGSGWGSGAAGSPNAQIGAYSLTLQKID